MADPVDLNFVTTDVLGGSVLQWATPFTDVTNLVDQAIAKLKPGQCIRRLVIAGHGAEKTDGFFVFDPLTSGTELIVGGQKQPIDPKVVTQLQRLKAHFCKDAIIEFRVCRFGQGKKGEQAVQAVADAIGVAVTAPMGEISSLAAIGGLATDWRVAYPKSWGQPSTTSFWRGSPTRQPAGAPAPADIAPITAQVVPLRAVTAPPPATPPPVRKVVIANPQPPPVSRGVAATGVVVVGGLLIVGWIVFNLGSTPTEPIGALPSPSAQPTISPTEPPTVTPSEPPTQPPTEPPTQPPTEPPTPTSAIAVLPPDGTYEGSGTFTSFDGSESYPTAWRITLDGDSAEIAQLIQPGGAVFQQASGIVSPTGLIVAVANEPSYCEALVLPTSEGQLSSDFFIAYGPGSMNCPAISDIAQAYLAFQPEPAVLESELRNLYEWGGSVVVGSADIPIWGVVAE